MTWRSGPSALLSAPSTNATPASGTAHAGRQARRATHRRERRDRRVEAGEQLLGADRGPGLVVAAARARRLGRLLAVGGREQQAVRVRLLERAREHDRLGCRLAHHGRHGSLRRAHLTTVVGHPGSGKQPARGATRRTRVVARLAPRSERRAAPLRTLAKRSFASRG